MRPLECRMQTRNCSAPGKPLTCAEFRSVTGWPSSPRYHQEKSCGVGGAAARRPPAHGRFAGGSQPSSRCLFTSCTTQWPTPFRVWSTPKEMLSPRLRLSNTAALPLRSAHTWCLSSGNILACSVAAAIARSKAGSNSDDGASHTGPPPPLGASRRRLAGACLRASPSPVASSRSSTMTVSRLPQPASLSRKPGRSSGKATGGTPSFSNCRAAGTPIFSATRVCRSATVASSGTSWSVAAPAAWRRRSVRGIA
mmetsp:Transcript_45549/g.145273  ORF Transcript_45549/g.145273 Transcript_45549/m.145273 type:complete len:253 (+) Transcript_45549:146-904(+)